MTTYQNASDLPASSLKPDIAIIGGGIVGLWTAYYAALSGQNILLIDKDKLGHGASYGLLGALMPHQPINWNDKKQFQLDGLTTLPDQIANLQARSEADCGYFRCGRIMPIGNEAKRKQSTTWAQGAKEHWVSPFDWTVHDKNPADGWLNDIGPHGYNSDDLSARINPRALVKALTVMMGTFSNVTILTHSRVHAVENGEDLSDYTMIAFGGAAPLQRGSRFRQGCRDFRANGQRTWRTGRLHVEGGDLPSPRQGRGGCSCRAGRLSQCLRYARARSRRGLARRWSQASERQDRPRRRPCRLQAFGNQGRKG